MIECVAIQRFNILRPGHRIVLTLAAGALAASSAISGIVYAPPALARNCTSFLDKDCFNTETGDWRAADGSGLGSSPETAYGVRVCQTPFDKGCFNKATNNFRAADGSGLGGNRLGLPSNQNPTPNLPVAPGYPGPLSTRVCESVFDKSCFDTRTENYRGGDGSGLGDGNLDIPVTVVASQAGGGVPATDPTCNPFLGWLNLC